MKRFVIKEKETSPLIVNKEEGIQDESTARLLLNQSVDILEASMMKHLTGRKRTTKIEKYFTQAFIDNLDLVARMTLACLLASILVNIQSIAKNIESPDFAVVIATLSFGSNFGENLTSLSTCVGIILSLLISITYTQISYASDKLSICIFIFFITLIISFSRYSIITQKYSILVLALSLLFWSFMNTIASPFNVIPFALKLATSCALGYGVLLICSFIPFPHFAMKRIKKRITLATKCLDLLVRMLGEAYGSPEFRKNYTKLAEMKALVNICDQKLSDISKMMKGASVEMFFSSIEGIKQRKDFLISLLVVCRSTLAALQEFDDKGTVNKIRSLMSIEVSNLTQFMSGYLMTIFDEFERDEDFNDLKKATESLRESFSKHRPEFQHSIEKMLPKDKSSTFSVPSIVPTKKKKQIHEEFSHLKEEIEEKEKKQEKSFNEFANISYENKKTESPEFEFLKKKADQLKPKRLKEIYATYFFIFRLLELSSLISHFKWSKLTEASCKSFGSNLKDIIYTPLSLNSVHYPKLMDYVKSPEFLDRLTHSLLYSVAVLIACIFVAVPQLASLFSGGFPFGIPGTVIFVFAGSTGSSFALAKARIGGTLIGDLFAFLVLKLAKPTPFSIVSSACVFVLIMSLISVDNPDISMVSIFVGLSTLYSRPDSNSGIKLEEYIVESLLQTFIGVFLILLVYSFRWWTNSSRKLMKINFVTTMFNLKRAILYSAFVVDNVGDKMSIIEYDYKASFKYLLKVREILNEQKILLNEMKSEPSLWRPKVRESDYTIVFNELESICELIEWLVDSADGINSFIDLDEEKLILPIAQTVHKIVDGIMSSLDVASRAISKFDDSGLAKDFTTHKELDSLVSELEKIAYETLRKHFTKADSKLLSCYLSFIFSLGKVANSTTILCETVFNWKVTYYLDVSHF